MKKNRVVATLVSLILLVAGLAGAAEALPPPVPVCVAGGPNPGTCVIDDFTKGPARLTLWSPGFTPNAIQSGNRIVGEKRCTVLGVSSNPLRRRTNLDIRRGYLIVDTGVQTGHAIFLAYGYDDQCLPVGLNLDLSGHDRFRLDVHSSDDVGTAGAIVVFTSNGNSSAALGIEPGKDFIKEVPFSEFVGVIDWTDVQQIGVVIQSAGVALSNDYAIRSIQVVKP